MENDDRTVPRSRPEAESPPPVEADDGAAPRETGTSGDEEHGNDYPLRPPDKDPRWAVNTVRIWLGIAIFSLAFILALMLLGVFYD